MAEANRNDKLEKSGVTQNRDPVVSVIVPARNEEAGLAACLESLVTQTGIVFEIVVVDDGSTDHTAEIARSFATNVTAGLQDRPVGGENREGTASALPKAADSDSGGFSPSITVISAPPLPEHSTGKNNAMAAGAKVAHRKAKWLLFTDADTVHKPGALARAVGEAEQHGAALLSYSPEQEVRTFWEKAVMPVIFAELAATYPPKKVNDPDSPIAAANGQYLLISREAYDAVGGHTKVANDLLEDVAMARLVKSSGRKIFFRYGGDAVRTRMYRSWSQMKEGWTKNLALLFEHPLRLAMRYLIESLLLFAGVGGLIRILLFGPLQIPSQNVILPHYPIPDQFFPSFKLWLTGCLILSLLYPILKSVLRLLKAHFRLRFLPASMLGSPIFAYLLLRSTTTRKSGAVSWKGRKYGNTGAKTTAPESPRTARQGLP